MTYLARTRTSILIPEMKATSFFVFCTRTPMCQSGKYPGAVRALEEGISERKSWLDALVDTYQSKNSLE